MKTDMNKLREIFAKMHQGFRKVVMQLQVDPRFIYHCSSANAIFSILKNKNIRFVKSSALLGDPFDSVLHIKKLKEQISPEIKLLHEGYDRLINSRGLDNDFYIFCGSMNPPSNKQFQIYGDGDKGLSLRFDWRLLGQGLLNFEKNFHENYGYYPCGAMEVGYDQSSFEEKVFKIMQMLADTFSQFEKNFEKNDGFAKEQIGLRYESYLKVLGALYKAPEFSWEEEMRFYIHSSEKLLPMIKEGRYIEFPWHEHAKSSLNGIIIGRNVENKKQIKKEIREILSDLDLREVKII
jgi:hypothetical protein